MLESLVAFIKTLPVWLGHVVEILFIAVVFLTSVTFLAGIWFGLCLIKRKQNLISEIQFMPPKIVFKNTENTPL